METAICAFGGSLNPTRKQEARSIFRLKGDASRRQLYEKSLQSRYYLSGSHISWEVEKDPPIYLKGDDEDDDKSQDQSRAKSSTSKRGDGDKSRSSEASIDSNTLSTQSNQEKDPKLKYRCKLCGQQKQSHNCPFQQALARSIGVMVYPAVNSFTAAEPGTVAPSLTKMNNFVSYDSDQGSNKPSGGPLGTRSKQCLTTVTPDTLRNNVNGVLSSPYSSVSNHSDEHPTPPSVASTSSARRRKLEENASMEEGYPSKRTRHAEGPGIAMPFPTGHKFSPESPTKHAIFVSSVTLRPEHYRAVTPKSDESPGSGSAYSYPVVPLTFSERKRLSDTLFHLSKEVPSMTADCAMVLREARKNNEWDLAVAELLTQVVVGLFCVEGDCRLDGLQQYLLSIGISC